MIEQWTTIEAISDGMASPKAGIFRETGFWYRADLCVSTVDTSLDINEVILCTDNHTTYDRFYSHHGSHNGYMYYVGMISVYNIELNLDFGIDTLASVFIHLKP